ncbi:DEAD/DEAH box helicase [Candidatus Woesearchaeota archaeon]|nr:DEAD/DEAH box helicase [Candidatus Woesearchaeota archaeon]
MLKDFTPRLYQETIFSTCNEKNTLVVLPTGMGKTGIVVMLAAQRLRNYPNSKILFLAPTKPLAEQHLNTFKRHLSLEAEEFAVMTGAISPEKRAALWKKSRLFFATPQGLENDIISGKIDLSQVSLLVFDEAHRATGDYAYNFVAKMYEKIAKYPRIIGLTASPGSDLEKINEVCQNLHIEDVEIRTPYDPDVKPYVQDIDIRWVYVDLPPEFLAVKKHLDECFRSKLRSLKTYAGQAIAKMNIVTKKDLIALQGHLHSLISQGQRDGNTLKAISLVAEAVKVQHALELLETQGITPLSIYMERLVTESSKTKVMAIRNLVSDEHFKSALILTRNLAEQGQEHPKLDRVKELVAKEMEKNTGQKIIVFNHYRDNAVKVVDELGKIPGAKPKLFVGQMKKGTTGMSQKKQIETLEEFKRGEFNIIVMTSIGEEGLDIPEVDLVVFYEAIPSAIRHIQRRGRTGRQKEGKVIVMVAKNTRDEAYKWTAFHKEKRMHTTLVQLKSKMGLKLDRKKTPTLQSFLKPADEQVIVHADVREKGSGVIKGLIDLNAKIELKSLEVCDYVVSKRCAIEFKTTYDFVDSIVDGRLLSQLKNMKQSYERPVVIVEGIEDIFSLRKVHPNAIRGMLATIAVSYGIPIMQTKTAKDSAALIYIIAKREQEEGERGFMPHGEKKPLSIKELQEYIVSSFPGVGGTLSKPLLKRFGSVKNIVNASEDDLQQVDLIGGKKAKAIREALDSEYESKK